MEIPLSSPTPAPTSITFQYVEGVWVCVCGGGSPVSPLPASGQNVVGDSSEQQKHAVFRAWIVDTPYPPALFFSACLHDPVPHLTTP